MAGQNPMLQLQQAQQMTEMQTAQFYQQYMQQYQAMVAMYDSRLGDGTSSSGEAAASHAQPGSSEAAPRGAVAMPPIPLSQPHIAQPQSIEEMRADLLRLDQEVKEAEMKAKRAATLSNHYVGIIDRFDTRKGHGFVACPETYARYKQDIFIDRESFQGAKVGDTVVFSLGFNKKGAVRACDVRKLNEVSRLKEELDEKRNQLFATLPTTSQSNSKGGGKKSKPAAAANRGPVAGWEKNTTDFTNVPVPGGAQNSNYQKRPTTVTAEGSSLVKRVKW